MGLRRLVWLLPLALAAGCAHPYPAAGLRPLPLLMRGGWSANPIVRVADSVRPTLRWEAFPRPEDLKADKAGLLGGARDTTYEVRVWLARDDVPGEVVPGELVYARTGLVEPAHTLETPLAFDTLHLWTVRAHFALQGERRVSEWAVLLVGNWGWSGRETQLPPRGYYRFRTPKGT